jgi:hypothetical protein
LTDAAGKPELDQVEDVQTTPCGPCAVLASEPL